MTRARKSKHHGRTLRPRPAPLTLLEPVPDGSRGPGRWEVKICGWNPTPLNQLLGSHWGTAARLKKLDADTVRLFSHLAHIPKATGKRRISLRIVLPKGQRRFDVDALFKTTLDAAKHAGMIIDDNTKWCELGEVTYSRGVELSTTLVVEDVDQGAGPDAGRGGGGL